MIRAGEEVLDLCTEATGLEYDPVLGKQLQYDAEREIPGPATETWPARLALMGKAFGLRISRVQLSVGEAIATARPDMPVVIRTPGEDEAHWIVLVGRRGNRGVLAARDRGSNGETISQKELVKRLGVEGRSSKLGWVLVLPIAPYDSLRDPHHGGHEAAGAHDHGNHGDDHHHGPSPFRRLLSLVRIDVRRDLTLILAYAIGVSILSLATPLAIEMLVTTIAKNQMVQQLIVLTLILFGCVGLAGLLRALQTYMVELVQRRVFVRVSADLAYRLPRVRIDAFDRANGPELVNRFFDILTVQKVGALLLLDGISILLSAAAGLLILAFYHPYLLGFDLIVLASMAFVVFLLGRGAIRTSIQESLSKYRVAAGLEEVARAPLAFKGDNAAEFSLDRVDLNTRRYLDARRLHFAILMRQIVFALGLQAIATSALLGLGGLLVINNAITLGQLVAAELIVATVVAGFAKLGKHLEAWYDLMAAMDKLGHLIDLPLERIDGEACPEPNFGRGLGAQGLSVKARHLSYGYSDHHHVLESLNLDIASGERVALVGPSGSGKSTLIDLFYGLRQPQSGSIELDGVNLRDIRLDSLRQQVAMVKRLEMIEDSIIENVRVGRGWISISDVRDALASVDLLDELSDLPDGLQTRINSDGAPLSLGQARRVMIARAIVGHPRLILIDEGLDGVDVTARQRVVDTLFDRSAPWTLVIVTHAQDIAKHADRAVALSDGRTELQMEMSNGHSRDIEDWIREVRS